MLGAVCVCGAHVCGVSAPLGLCLQLLLQCTDSVCRQGPTPASLVPCMVLVVGGSYLLSRVPAPFMNVCACVSPGCYV